MLSWTFTALLLLAVLVVWFWQTSLSVRERANRAAQDACERAQLQFLDGTVAFSHLRLTRNETGRITLRRTYLFDYTAASIERRQGFVMMLGDRLEHIGFAANDGQMHSATHGGHFPTKGLITNADTEHDEATQDAKVLNLEEWRRHKANQPHGGSAASSTKPSDSNHDSGW